MPEPIRYCSLDWRTDSADVVQQNIKSTPYGVINFFVRTGTGLDNGFILGQSDALATNTIPVEASSNYGVSVRVYGVIDYSNFPAKLQIKDQAGTVLGTSSTTLVEGWQTLETTFVTGVASTHIQIEIVKDNDVTDGRFSLAGVMLIEGTTIPAGYNAGHQADLYDNITSSVMDANWYLGFKKPYQEMPHASVLKLTLNNTQQWFSPEYQSGTNPLQGFVEPYRPVQIQAFDSVADITRTHWQGWIESIQPTTNQYGNRQVTMRAKGPEQFFANVETSIEIQENKRTDEIVERLLQEVDMPPPLTLTTLWTPACSSNDTILDDLSVERVLEIGKSTLAYAADNWVRRSADSDQSDTFNIFRALKDTVGAERGRLFFNRDGQAIFWNRHSLITNVAITASLNDDMSDLRYEYAGTDEFANDVQVTCHPRTISDATDELLWKLENPVKLQPDDERTIGASFHDDSDNRIGGKDVYLDNVTFETGQGLVTGTLTMDGVGANRVKLLLSNTHQSKSVVLKTAEIRGKKITDFGRMDATASDSTSIAHYGLRDLKLNLLAVDNQNHAQNIADFELIRRKQPSGKVQTVTLRSHGKKGGGLHTHQLARTIGDRIEITESQTGHTGEYFIIGEEHQLKDAANMFETIWYLESATEGDFIIIDEDVIDSSATMLVF